MIKTLCYGCRALLHIGDNHFCIHNGERVSPIFRRQKSCKKQLWRSTHLSPLYCCGCVWLKTNVTRKPHCEKGKADLPESLARIHECMIGNWKRTENNSVVRI